jgi:hypothetical protein
VHLQIDRLENKIKALAELAFNRREQDFLSNHIDELGFVTGFSGADGLVPELLR